MEQLLQLILEVRVLRLLQLIAVTALVLLLATEPELLLVPMAIKVREMALLPRRLLTAVQARRVRKKASMELQLARERAMAVLRAEMPALLRLPQTVEQLARTELAPLPFPAGPTRTRSSTDLPKQWPTSSPRSRHQLR